MTSAEPNVSLSTPDFYRYRWAPIVTVEAAGTGTGTRWDQLYVSWADGVELRINHCWLQENAAGRSVDPITREGLIDPAELVTTGSIAAASVTADGALQVDWSDGHEPSRFHPGWLRHIADGEHRPQAWLPKPVSWTTDSLAEPPTHSFDAMCWPDANGNIDRGWLAFVDDLLTFGLARIVDAPTTRDGGRAQPDDRWLSGSRPPREERASALRCAHIAPMGVLQPRRDRRPSLVGADHRSRSTGEPDHVPCVLPGSSLS